jgi:hypothetical protein
MYGDIVTTTGKSLVVKTRIRHHDAWVLGETDNPPDEAAVTGPYIGNWALPDKGDDLTVNVVLPWVATLVTIPFNEGTYDADVTAAVRDSGFGERPWYAGHSTEVDRQAGKVKLTIYRYVPSHLRVTHKFEAVGSSK